MNRKTIVFAWIVAACVCLGVPKGLLGMSSPSGINKQAKDPICPLAEGQWAYVPDVSDEFAGSSLDTNKWRLAAWVGGLKESQRTDIVSDGILHLTANIPSISGQTNILPTPHIVTRSRIRYGYIEAKFRMTKAPANNAFWLVYGNDNPEGFGYSEIDICEGSSDGWFGNEQGKTARIDNGAGACVHVDLPIFDKAKATKSLPSLVYPLPPCSLAEEFHTYGLEWDENFLKIYFDGQLMNTRPNLYSHYPLWVVLSVYPDPRSRAEDLPSTMDVGYVRCWQRTDIQDRRIYNFTMTLPGTNHAPCNIKTEDGGLLVVSWKPTRSGYIGLDYLNPSWFQSETNHLIRKRVEVKDTSNKTVCFNMEWSRDYEKGYVPYNLTIEPKNRKPRGTEEQFVFPAEDGQEVRMTITH